MPASMASSSRRSPAARRRPPAGGEPRSRQRRTAWPNSPDVIGTTVCGATGRFPGTGSPRKTGRLAAGAARRQAGSMTTTLITGANKGLGYETARRLIAAGHTVYLGSRDTGRGRDAAARLGPRARLVLLDVTDDASVDAAAKTIEADGGLGVLGNNAGIR